MDSAESTQSPWKTVTFSDRPPLTGDAVCDVCVVGAGIAGLSAAYQLSREGRRVVVLEATDIGGGETAQTTAHLASALDDRFASIERVRGEQGARLAYQSHARAIDEIEAIVRRESIRCDFARVNGYLFLGQGQDESLLDDELDAAQRIGFVGAHRIARAPIEAFDTGSCLVFPRQARFHPLHYLAGLASAVEHDGGAIHPHTRANHVRGGRSPKVSTDAGFEVHAEAVIVATNSPFHLRLSLHSKQAPYRTYAIALTLPSGSVVDALYWDTCDPYHYVRLEAGVSGCDLLIVGGEDQRTATTDDADIRYRRLECWARERFPRAGEVAYRWSGQVLEPFDHLAFIGADPTGERNIYLATGDSGHGLTHGALAGMLLADLIAGRNNPWKEIYDPARKTVRAAGEYVRDNLEVAAEYTKWLTPEHRRRPQVLERGEGAVIQRGKRKIALYRDVEGALHERSAVCTHLGCVVRWNSDAKSWDCRCHGSRFAPTGEVLNGPAVDALAVLDPPAEATRRRSLAIGGLGGALATVAMTAALMVAKPLGLLGQFPPRKIVQKTRRRMGLLWMPRSVDNFVTTAAHWGFGVATGALFGLLHRRRRGFARSAIEGAGYGAAVWAASYYGWVPALGLMRAPHRDRLFRPASMVAAHLVYGTVLGAFVELETDRRT
jgi:glycine/D-amino acid oxidase-like deaminating enzyme/nitrite reductase/ring-hydroxylating ferredoxin subunit